MAPLLGELQDLYRISDYGADIAFRVQNLSEGLAALYQNYNAVEAQHQGELQKTWLPNLDALRLRWTTWRDSVLVPAVQKMTQSSTGSMHVPGTLITLKGWERVLVEMQTKMAKLGEAFEKVTKRKIGAAERKDPPWRCDALCIAKLVAVGAGVVYVGSLFGWWTSIGKWLKDSGERYKHPPRYATRR